MSREYMEFDTTPFNEPTIQVGSPDYPEKVRTEYKAMKNQLLRMFPIEEYRIKLKSCLHDFGEYHEIRIYWDNASEADTVFGIESAWPDKWDDKAKQELTELGYFK